MGLSFKERDGAFAALDCADWADFKTVASHFMAQAANGQPCFEQFVFRGQSCSSWPLISSFDRKHRDLSFRELDDRYRRVIDAFIRNYEIYGDENSPFRGFDNFDELRYETLAQHFGLPTRLLDWTKSLYVAAFFAFSKVEECTSDLVAIWCLHRHHFSKSFSDQHVVLLENVYKENRRQLWQMGVFITNKTADRNFIDLFRASSRYIDARSANEDPLLVRFDVPRTALAAAIDDLNMMRINSMTLFPGIDGVVRWIDRGGYAIS